MQCCPITKMIQKCVEIQEFFYTKYKTYKKIHKSNLHRSLDWLYDNLGLCGLRFSALGKVGYWIKIFYWKWQILRTSAWEELIDTKKNSNILIISYFCLNRSLFGLSFQLSADVAAALVGHSTHLLILHKWSLKVYKDHLFTKIWC